MKAVATTPNSAMLPGSGTAGQATAAVPAPVGNGAPWMPMLKSMMP